MTGLLKLAERCEQATGPSRHLDTAIWLAAKADEASLRAYDEGLKISKQEAAFRADYMSDGARFTASLDAAMTLVPEGESAGFRIAHHPELRRKSWAEVWLHEDAEPGDGFFRSAAQTPALALCAAALRARANEVNP